MVGAKVRMTIDDWAAVIGVIWVASMMFFAFK